jgi:dTDP-4-dehydrorhamnose reductase
MKILLLGAKGQVGWELQRSLAPLGQLKACDRETVDLEDLDELQTTIREYSPDFIVNAAAYTAVDRAESEPDKAHRINAEAIELLAIEARRLDAWLIHYSTDYVFDGSKPTAYNETDSPNPQSVYGRTKLDGEKAIRKSGCNHLIFRTSWVYAARGSNFAKTMLRLAGERDELKVVGDQIGAPTSAELIADITALCLYRIIQDREFGEVAAGIYHLSPSGETNWCDYARYVVAQALTCGVTLRSEPDDIQPITTSEYPVPAKRPANSRLDTKKLEDTFGVFLPIWQDQVKRLIIELVMKDEL